MEIENGTKKKQILLSNLVKLPSTIKYHQIEDKHLFIAPYNPSWIVTNDIGAVMLSPLSQGYTVGEAIDFAVNQLNIDRTKALDEMKILLNEIEAKAFYQDGQAFETAPKIEMGSLQLFLTRSCNLQCIHCYMDGGCALENELSLEEWKKVIDLFTEMYGKGWVTLSGGEPLSRPDFFEIAEYAKNKGHNIYLLTNGTLIKDAKMAGRIAQLVDDIQISLDGASREITDRIRGDGVFDQVLNAIELLKQEKKRIKLAFVVLPENIADLEKNLVPLVTSFQYKAISINIDDRPTKMGRANEFLPDNYRMPIKNRQTIDNIMKQIHEKGWGNRPTGLLNRKLLNCGIGNGFSVDANGDVYPCPMPIAKFGNLRHDDLQKLAMKINNLQAETSVENMKMCRDCDLKYICVGGCRILGFEETGDFLIPDCNENSKKIIFFRMIDRWI
ncbi:MAG: radical SAM protein [Acidobacteria bacterium]|nr:radical SAM protein [Acidobacteriota bacterium]